MEILLLFSIGINTSVIVYFGQIGTLVTNHDITLLLLESGSQKQGIQLKKKVH